MPPKEMAKLAKSETNLAVPAVGDEILALFDLNEAGLAIVANGWDLAEEFELLIQRMRDPDPSVSLRAQAQYRRTILDMLRVNGVMATSTQSETFERDGVTVTRTASTHHMLSNLKGRNEYEREDAPYDDDSFDPDQ